MDEDVFSRSGDRFLEIKSRHIVPVAGRGQFFAYLPRSKNEHPSIEYFLLRKTYSAFLLILIPLLCHLKQLLRDVEFRHRINLDWGMCVE